jgi:hypothetical protein
MSVLHGWIGRRLFLSSTLVGAIGMFLRCNRRPRRNGSVRARECRGALSDTRAQYEPRHGHG